MKKILTYIGYLLTILSIVYLIGIFVDNISVFQAVSLSITNVAILFVLFFLYISIYLIFSYSWVLQLREKYPQFRLKESISIIGMSQIGKYLPGNIGHFIGRLIFLPKYMSKKDASYTMLIENVAMLTSSCVMGVFYVIYFDFFKEINFKETIIVIALISTIIIFFYFGLKYLRSKIDFIKINIFILIKVLTLTFILLFVSGISIYLLNIFFTGKPSISYLQFVTGFALAFVVGFVMPGAPGGIGVREYTFVVLFSSFITEAIALQIILAYRVINVVGDLIFFGTSTVLRRNMPKI